MSASAILEEPMARKKEEAPPSMITVKIRRAIHAKLAIIASVERRDISDLLSEISEGPVERRYKQALAKLNAAE